MKYKKKSLFHFYLKNLLVNNRSNLRIFQNPIRFLSDNNKVTEFSTNHMFQCHKNLYLSKKKHTHIYNV